MAPLLFVWSPRRWRVALGFGIVAALMLLPFVAAPRGLYESVLGYHSERGIEIGSIWGAAMLAGDRLGATANLAVDFGAFEVSNSLSDTMVTASNLLAAAGLAAGTYLAWRLRKESLGRLSLVMLATMAFLVGIGKVYSAQYVVWLVALGAAALTLAPRRTRPAALVLVALPALTYWYFPVRYLQLVQLRDWPSILVLLVRDLVTLVVAGLALWGALTRRAGSDEDVATLQEDVGSAALIDAEDTDVVPAGSRREHDVEPV
jgi:hypothetical protein